MFSRFAWVQPAEHFGNDSFFYGPSTPAPILAFPPLLYPSFSRGEHGGLDTTHIAQDARSGQPLGLLKHIPPRRK